MASERLKFLRKSYAYDLAQLKWHDKRHFGDEAEELRVLELFHLNKTIAEAINEYGNTPQEMFISKLNILVQLKYYTREVLASIDDPMERAFLDVVSDKNAQNRSENERPKP